MTTICPGLIRTGSPRQAMVRGQHEKEYAWFKISDSLPGFSASAEYVAASIIDACRYGESQRIISLPAKVAGAVHGLFPGLMTDVLSLVNALLPDPDPLGHNSPQKMGRDVETGLSQNFLTTLTDDAAVGNNET